jgi:hypothetical protein
MTTIMSYSEIIYNHLKIVIRFEVQLDRHTNMVIYHTSNMSLMSQKITSSVVLIVTAFVLVSGGSNIFISSSAASSNTRVAA